MPTRRAAPVALAALAAAASAFASLAVPVALPTAAAAGGVELTVTVDRDAPVDAGCSDSLAGLSLREALCSAAGQPAATVVVPAGFVVTLAVGPLVVDPVLPSTDVTVRTAGPGRFTIDGADRRILDLDPSMSGGLDVTLTGVVLRHGASTAADAGPGGGAILAGSADPGAPDSLTIVDCLVQDNRNAATGVEGVAGAAGGAVSMTGGTLTVRDSTFTGNVADGAPGGAIAMFGIDSSDSLVIEGSTFEGNVITPGAGDGVLAGGAVFADDVALSVTGSTFRHNAVTSTSATAALGSAVRATVARAGAATISGSVVEGNTLTSSADRAVAGGGGALALASGTVTASRLVGNTDTVGGSTAPVSVLATTGSPIGAAGNWWGSATGAGAAAVGATTVPFATLTPPTAPDYPTRGVATTASAHLTLSDGTAVAPALAALLAGTVGELTLVQGSGTAGGPATLTTGGVLSVGYTPGVERSVTATATLDGVTVSGQIDHSSVPELVGPVDVSAAEGQTATLAATVDAYPAATALRWQSAPAGSSTWTDVPGATTATLDVPATRADQGRRYRLLATNMVGTTTSGVATLEVLWGAEITTQPVGTTVVVGDEATFTVGVAGHLTPTVQWQTAPAGTADWTDVPGGTATTAVRPAVTAADDGLQVRAVVQGSVGPVTSDVAVLHVQTPATVATSPSAATGVEGGTVSLSATFEATPAPTRVVWQRFDAGAGTWTDLSGGTTTSGAGTTTATLDVAVTRALDGARFRVRAEQTLVSGPRVVTSAEAALDVSWVHAVLTQPVDATALAGQDATFSVVTDGRPAPTVTWEALAPGGAGGWVAVGAGSTLTLTGVDVAADGTQVRARLVGPLGPDVLSGTATLEVRQGASILTQPAGTTVDDGDVATFTVAAGGHPAPSVRWQERATADGTWVDVVGASGSTLTVTATPARHGHEFRAVAGNGVLADATSDAAALTVLTAPSVSDPQDAGTVPGGTARFTVTATGNPAPTIGWQTSVDGLTWVTVPGAVGGVLDLAAAAGDDGLLLRAVATSTLVAGPRSQASAAATLTVVDLPVEVSGPDGVTPTGTLAGAAGTPVTIGWVVLASDGVGTWQASRDGGSTWGALPAGATTQEVTGVAAVRSLVVRAAAPATRTAYRLTYTPSAADTGLQVRLVVTNAAGSTVMGPVRLQVAPVVLTPGGGTGGTAQAGASATASRAAGTSTTATRSLALARTGADVPSLLLLVVVLMGSGTAVLVLRRRRATTTTPAPAGPDPLRGC
ncbi:hypothetical protein ACTHAM_002069 [Cellulomonas soli]|uniref:hypothetical protein n=1 Tax=Cellulomonas soli TaxID=931535 RepID=UPI003F82A81A